MTITDVEIFIVGEEKLKAFATITIEHSLVVRDLRVVEGEKGLFVAMPNRKRKDGTYRDIVHPIDEATRRLFTDEVLKAYERNIERGQAGKSSRAGAIDTVSGRGRNWGVD